MRRGRFVRLPVDRQWFPLVLLLALQPAELAAQTESGHAQLFVLAGPGTFSADSVGYAGGGLEYIRRNGIGFGAEVAWAWGFQPDRPGGAGRATQLTSIYAKAQSARADKKFEPFAMGGLGFISNAISDTELAFVLGAGSNWWLRQGLGLKAEVLVPLGLADTGGAIFAIGVTFK